MAAEASTDVQLLGSKQEREGQKAMLRSYLRQNCYEMLSSSYKEQEITVLEQRSSIADNLSCTCKCKMSNYVFLAALAVLKW